MPRARGFRDPRTIVLQRQKPQQLSRLLRPDFQRISTSRLSARSIENVLRRVQDAQLRHQRRVDRTQPRSPQDGFVAAVKDNFVTKEFPSTCASSILEGFSAEDATVVSLLKEAGMEVVMKTNMDEFGMGSHSTHSAYGPVQNGTGSEALSAGGSSGGSALAVARGLVDAAIGSDTGGSVRLPAAYTRVVGFKPSYGIISRHGLIPYANSLDTVGLFGKTCLDVFLLFKLLAQYDHKDPTSLSEETRLRIQRAREARTGRYGNVLRPSVQDTVVGLPRSQHVMHQDDWLPFHKRPHSRRIGVPVEYNIAEMHSSVREAWVGALNKLQSQGHEIVPISLPSTQQALSAYYVLAPAEASSNLAKYDGVRYGKLRGSEFKDDEGGLLYSQYRDTHFGEEVRRRILLGSFTLSAGAIDNYFIQAQKVRRMVQSDFNMVFKMANPLLPRARRNKTGVDYIVCPTAPTPPPTITEVKNASPLESYMNDVFTVPASLAGLPAISVPAPQDRTKLRGADRAIGLQVIGQFGDDHGVIAFASKYLEHEVGFKDRRDTIGYQRKLR